MRLQHGTYESFASIEASNDSLAATVLPELGGKLVSLRDLRSGQEWLWRSQRLALAKHVYGVSYIEKADTGGWDECFPSVAACKYPLAAHHSQQVPDHGDVWSQPWRTEVAQTQHELCVAGSCRTLTLPCTFSRTLKLSRAGARLALEYSVHNHGSAPVAFIWSAHPLFALTAGMRLEFPPQTRFNVYSATPRTQMPQTPILNWPFVVRSEKREIALDPLPGRDAGIAFKVWSEPLLDGWAALHARHGSLCFRFDVRQIPQIALWLNAGGWSGIGGEPYYNLALEPCIGAQDSLEEAVLKYGQYVLLPPDQSRQWRLEVELQASSRPA